MLARILMQLREREFSLYIFINLVILCVLDRVKICKNAAMIY